MTDEAAPKQVAVAEFKGADIEPVDLVTTTRGSVIKHLGNTGSKFIMTFYTTHDGTSLVYRAPVGGSDIEAHLVRVALSGGPAASEPEDGNGQALDPTHAQFGISADGTRHAYIDDRSLLHLKDLTTGTETNFDVAHLPAPITDETASSSDVGWFSNDTKIAFVANNSISVPAGVDWRNGPVGRSALVVIDVASRHIDSVTALPLGAHGGVIARSSRADEVLLNLWETATPPTDLVNGTHHQLIRVDFSSQSPNVTQLLDALQIYDVDALHQYALARTGPGPVSPSLDLIKLSDGSVHHILSGTAESAVDNASF